MSVGKNIKARRKQLGMNAETLAEMLGVSPSTIYRYESGEIEKVDSAKLIPIAEALRTTPGYLMGWGRDIIPTEQTTTIEIPNASIKPDVERAALAASETLIRHHIDNAPIFPMSILQSMPNVIVMTFTEMADKSGMDRTNLVTMFGSDTQDVIAYLRGNEYCVAYNQRLPYYMLQRAMARELGHILLGHHTSTLPEQTQTMEALYFSRYLLCPRPLLKRLFDAGINMTVETLGNITGLYGRSLAGIRETPGAHIPTQINCKIRDQFTGYLQRAMDYIKSESVENVAKATFGSYMDNYEE